MTTNTSVQLPFRRGVALSVGPRTFRKQVLPVGQIDYKGRRINFDRSFLTDLAESFRAGAYDQVPFILAAPDNSHTMDPERFRGEVKGLELSDDGLYALLELSEEGAAVVAANPNLGVSARIVEGLQRADGKAFPRALQHVLGTLDPRVTGMKPWEPLNLSTEGGPLVDLTGAVFTNLQEAPVSTNTDELTAEERAKFDRYVTELSALTPVAPTPTTATSELDPALEAELAALLAAEAGEPSGAALSTEQLQAIELATAQSQADREALAAVQAELAEARYERTRSELVGAGVPPAMVELAKPLLMGSHVIELSATEKVDASEIVRKLLDESRGIVDLSGPTPAALKPNDEEATLLDQWEKLYPAAR